MSEINIRELIKKAREDEEARLEVLRSYEPLIKKCIRIYVKDFSFHCDALQQGYEVLLKCIYNYDLNREYPFGAYAKMSLIYALKDYGSKSKNDMLSLDEELGEEGGTLLETLQGSDNVEDNIVKEEDFKRLKMALDKLSAKHRDLIHEVYFENKSMMDVCRGRRCHYMTVVKLKDRALNSLRTEYEKIR